MRKNITLHGNKIPLVEYQGQRVVTFAMIDEVHQRPKGTAKRSFNQHKDKLIEGSDYFSLTQYEIRSELPAGFFEAKAASGVLLTEIGYLMVAKSLKDELAWQVQRELIMAYFRPVFIPSLDELKAMPPQEAQNILTIAEKKSLWHHGKHGSAEMNQLRRELKVLRPAIHHLNAIHQITIPGLEEQSTSQSITTKNEHIRSQISQLARALYKHAVLSGNGQYFTLETGGGTVGFRLDDGGEGFVKLLDYFLIREIERRIACWGDGLCMEEVFTHVMNACLDSTGSGLTFVGRSLWESLRKSMELFVDENRLVANA
ncbi:ORF6N domain-containing protein [Buttiauxella sp. S19-1]|uniref:ORF6N domain-containing protein n=1 Tax=Buttiauxella sp. S19-1 TaxID=941430 RepID=UPI001EDC229F|nr:ORF6N domain-containing protein [Buttiauxella sp. S19-1]